MTDDASRDRASIALDLENSDDEIRRLGVERLLFLPVDEAIPRLVERLGDESWRVRKAAVERLVACTQPDRVADALIEALADGENTGRRNSAVEALMAQGRVVVGKLIAALDTDDVDVRKLVVDALAGIRDVSARDAMIRTTSDEDPNIRAAAADALGALGGDDSVRALLSLALSEAEHQLVRFSSLRALARLECGVSPSRLVDVLEDPVLRSGGLVLLGYCDDDGEAVESLLKALSATTRAPREAAMRALLCMLSRCDGDEANALGERIEATALATEGLLENVIDRLETATVDDRLLLIQFLGIAGGETGVVPILHQTRDEAVAEIAMTTLEALGELTERALDVAWPDLEEDLRRRACRLLARTRGESGVERLASLLEDPDGELRSAAARALGERRAFGVIPDLVRRLETTARDDEPDLDDELDTLTEALVALVGEAPDAIFEQTVDLLALPLKDGSEAVRRSAARVFVAIGRSDHVSHMTQLLKDPSAQVRRLAVEGLMRLGSDEASERLRLALADESPLVRVASAAALASSHDSQALDDLGRLMGDEDPRVRAAALRAVAAYCIARREGGAGAADAEARAAELFGSLLRGDESDGMVRMAALEAIDRLGGVEVVALVGPELASEEPEVVQAAIGCIGRHGDRDMLELLIDVVQHPAWAVRADAVQILGDRRCVRALPAILRRLELEQDHFVREVLERVVRALEA